MCVYIYIYIYMYIYIYIYIYTHVDIYIIMSIIRPNMEVKDEGYMVGLYLDPLEQRYIEDIMI